MSPRALASWQRRRDQLAGNSNSEMTSPVILSYASYAQKNRTADVSLRREQARPLAELAGRYHISVLEGRISSSITCAMGFLFR